MTRIDAIEYGDCHCGGRYEGRSVDVYMTVEGQRLHLEVPQGACPNCGARVYRVDVLERVESTMRNEPMDPRTNRQA